MVVVVVARAVVLLLVLLLPTFLVASATWAPVQRSFNTKHFGKQSRTKALMNAMFEQLATCAEDKGCPRTTVNGNVRDRGCVGDTTLCPLLLGRVRHPQSILSYACGVGEETIGLHNLYNGTVDLFCTDLDDATVDKTAKRLEEFGARSFHIDRANDRTYDMVIFNFALFAPVTVDNYSSW